MAKSHKNEPIPATVYTLVHISINANITSIVSLKNMGQVDYRPSNQVL